jgi:hypothetical protein
MLTPPYYIPAIDFIRSCYGLRTSAIYMALI